MFNFKDHLLKVSEARIPMHTLEKQWNACGSEAFENIGRDQFFPWHFVPHLLNSDHYIVIDNDMMQVLSDATEEDYKRASEMVATIIEWSDDPHVDGVLIEQETVKLPEWYRDVSTFLHRERAQNPFCQMQLTEDIKILCFSIDACSVICRTEDLEQVLEIIFKESKS
jgi:hypothetical protein